MKKFDIKRTAIIVLLVGLIFSVGVQTGKGNITFGRSNNTSNSQLPENINYSSVEQVYDSLREQYDGELDYDKLLDGLKSGLVAASGDPYTEYLSEEQAKEFEGDLNGTFEGIGAELSKEDEFVVIVAPIKDMPADKAGLKPKDKISKINGENAFGMSVEEAKNKIRGPKGSKVKLTLIRDNKELEVEITRATINVPSVESSIKNGIGILTIYRYGDDTSYLARKAANEFKQAGVKGVVLDLRGNPGGYLEAAVNVSSLWLNNKVVLKEKRGDVVIKTYESRGEATLDGIPTVVLINEGSASASEITAGALKDNNAATLVGVKSYGKGSVQQPEPLQSGGILKVTIARWYTPDGKNIDKEGIKPDNEVKLTEEDYKNGKDPQLDAAIGILNN